MSNNRDLLTIESTVNLAQPLSAHKKKRSYLHTNVPSSKIATSNTKSTSTLKEQDLLSHPLQFEQKPPSANQPPQGIKAFGQIFAYFMKKNDNIRGKILEAQKFNGFRDQGDEKQQMQDLLQSMKHGGMFFENMPMLSFDHSEKGWKSIYQGILSPYTNKYQKYIEVALRKQKQQKQQMLSRMSTVGLTTKLGNQNQLQYEGHAQPSINEAASTLDSRKRPPQIITKSVTLSQTSIEEVSNKLKSLSNFKKERIFKEIIQGKMSRESHQYLQTLLKGADLDYPTRRVKKMLITKTLKENFLRPEDRLIQEQQQKSQPKSKYKIPLQLKEVMPHFQVDVDRFTYMDFEYCGHRPINDILNDRHKCLIKRDKHRNSVSMLAYDTTKHTRKVPGEYILKRGMSLEDFEEKAFLDAHHMNRRKSCVCTHCGGQDSHAIKKMDKFAMDMIKDNISPMLKRSFNKQRSHEKQQSLRRQQLEMLTSSDEPVSSPQVRSANKSRLAQKLLSASQTDEDKEISDLYERIDEASPYNEKNSNSLKSQTREEIAGSQETIKEFNLRAMLQQTELHNNDLHEDAQESMKTSYVSRLELDQQTATSELVHEKKQVKDREQALFLIRQKQVYGGPQKFKQFRRLSCQKGIDQYYQQQESVDSSVPALNKVKAYKIFQKIRDKTKKVSFQSLTSILTSDLPKGQLQVAEKRRKAKIGQSTSGMPRCQSQDINPQTIMPYLWKSQSSSAIAPCSAATKQRLWSPDAATASTDIMEVNPKPFKDIMDKHSAMYQKRTSSRNHGIQNLRTAGTPSFCQRTQFFASRLYQGKEVATSSSQSVAFRSTLKSFKN